MQGCFVGGHRPKTKKELKAAVATDPAHVKFEATSIFGGEYDGTAYDLPAGTTVSVVGPDPETNRKWYATVERFAGQVRVK